MNGKQIALAAALGLLVVGARTVGTGIKNAGAKTGHVVAHIFRHPVHSVKNGAIHEPEQKPVPAPK